jgi:hypothetical protein
VVKHAFSGFLRNFSDFCGQQETKKSAQIINNPCHLRSIFSATNEPMRHSGSQHSCIRGKKNQVEVKVEVKVKAKVQRVDFYGECYWLLVFGFFHAAGVASVTPVASYDTNAPRSAHHHINTIFAVQ